jgi:CubicO group peptidase (beta-lactamase class C family)
MCRKILSLILSVLFASANLTSGGQGLKSKNARAELIAAADSILQSQVDLDKIPGAVIEIKKGKRVIYKQAYGYARKYDYNQRELSHPEKMTTRHLFDIASLTKAIGTTTAVMLLADRGMINIEDPVCRYIKAFDTSDKRSITVHHLLTHTAGLYDWYPLYYRSDNKKETCRLIADLPRKYPVGEERHYSDLGFMLLGEIVENVSGLTLEQFLKQKVFKPLGMKNTTYNPITSGRYKRIASTSHGNPYEKRMVYDTTLGYRFREIDPMKWNGWRTYTLTGEVNDGNTWYACSGVSGAAGLFSTVEDLQKLVDMLVNKGEIHRGQFISAKTIDTFLTKDKFNNALGWMMDPVNSFMKNGPEGTFGHTGFTGTSIAVIPESGISVILLINRQNTGLSGTGEYYNVNPVRQQVFNAVLKYTGN